MYYISLDDFLQLQSLLDYEQDKRNRSIEECAQQNTTIQQYLLEKQRINEINLRLQFLKEQYRKRRVQEIQNYLEQYRRQALIEAVLQEEEERYYRQCIAAALEQRRAQRLREHYLQQKQLQQELNHQTDEDEEEEEEEEEGYSQYRSEQLSEFLKQLFDQEKERQEEETSTHDCDKVWKCVLDQREDAKKEREELDQESSLASFESPKQVEREPSPPPLQDHVITLQDLIQQMASQPVMVNEVNPYFSDEPKPSGIWMNQVPKEPTKEETTEKPFLPRHIVTEAEPTPTLESMPDTPMTQASSDFVDSVAVEQQSETTPAPEVQKVNKQLDDISYELRDDGEICKRWQQVLQSHLEFKKEEGGTLLLTASTDANRQFLGSEDELMRLMLKLDAIDSLGDDTIRQRRKSLVKKIESMLSQLDQLKKRHWERQQKKKKRHHKKKHLAPVK